MKLVTVTALIIAAITSTGLYYLKNEVRLMEGELAALNRTLSQDQEAIRVLHAEWNYLNQPSRLESLSARYLGLAPMESAQAMSIDDVPWRRVSLADRENEHREREGNSVPAPFTTVRMGD